MVAWMEDMNFLSEDGYLSNQSWNCSVIVLTSQTGHQNVEFQNTEEIKIK